MSLIFAGLGSLLIPLGPILLVIGGVVLMGKIAQNPEHMASNIRNKAAGLNQSLRNFSKLLGEQEGITQNEVFNPDNQALIQSLNQAQAITQEVEQSHANGVPDEQILENELNKMNESTQELTQVIASSSNNPEVEEHENKVKKIIDENNQLKQNINELNKRINAVKTSSDMKQSGNLDKFINQSPSSPAPVIDSMITQAVKEGKIISGSIHEIEQEKEKTENELEKKENELNKENKEIMEIIEKDINEKLLINKDEIKKQFSELKELIEKLKNLKNEMSKVKKNKLEKRKKTFNEIKKDLNIRLGPNTKYITDTEKNYYKKLIQVYENDLNTTKLKELKDYLDKRKSLKEEIKKGEEGFNEKIKEINKKKKNLNPTQNSNFTKLIKEAKNIEALNKISEEIDNTLKK